MTLPSCHGHNAASGRISWLAAAVGTSLCLHGLVVALLLGVSTAGRTPQVTWVTLLEHSRPAPASPRPAPVPSLPHPAAPRAPTRAVVGVPAPDNALTGQPVAAASRENAAAPGEAPALLLAAPPVAAADISPAAADISPAAADISPTAAELYHFNRIRDLVLARLSYPLAARRQGWQGTVTIAFTVYADGAVGELRVTASSGYPMLDGHALEAVRRAAPLPPPGKPLAIVLPVAFALSPGHS